MSELLYKANPSVWRSHPFGALIAWMLVLLGVVIAVTDAIPFLPEPTQPVQLPEEFQIRWLGYGLLLIGCFQLLRWWLTTLMDQLEIYERELVWTHGLLSKEYTEINMTSVRTVRIEQSLFQRIVGAGNLQIFTAGDAPELTIRGLPRPQEIRQHIKRYSAGDD
ncbi:MAG: PH domain-containing protein [Lamprobacter sp.]|uniref:PH domain-containing protein n=1 Tax=Lamprobacter sp. TaxID=3100796 RepID=UPI002B25A2E0|nr:PH domain-containing protein [Lamprobacter sp.]MEA3639580.1 PH domain-containing protein [Lamprobacter sp.]